MPYKSEKIKLTGLQDRRRKLTDEQKAEIIKKYSTGLTSLNKLAMEYDVSKKTILLIVNPDSLENSRNYGKTHWKDFQRSKEERTKAVRECRRYKQSLYLKGELVAEEANG